MANQVHKPGIVSFHPQDTEAFWTQTPEFQAAMIAWLRADLATANAARDAVPWVVALGHKGWWMDDTLNCPSGPGCGALYLARRDYIVAD